MTTPKPLFDATISYYTPSGRKVLYGAMIAANSADECFPLLLDRLNGEINFGRRRCARIANDFAARFITMQIATR